jgi:ABC-type Na+ transport system ATPase subunit NatA
LGLAGGGTDVSPFCDTHGGVILNATISWYAYATISAAPPGKVVFRATDLDVEVELDADLDLPMEEPLKLQLGMPVKTYSSGMRARLAFALSLAIEFDCYMIDEVIMVGDHNFQRKCHVELFEKRGDRALIMASHSAEIIREYCNSAVVLNKGKGQAYKDVEEALRVYDAL